MCQLMVEKVGGHLTPPVPNEKCTRGWAHVDTGRFNCPARFIKDSEREMSSTSHVFALPAEPLRNITLRRSLLHQTIIESTQAEQQDVLRHAMSVSVSPFQTSRDNVPLLLRLDNSCLSRAPGPVPLQGVPLHHQCRVTPSLLPQIIPDVSHASHTPHHKNMGRRPQWSVCMIRLPESAPRSITRGSATAT
jgi:hypothetical protein